MKIPPDQHPEILRRAGAGETSDQIAEWLGTVGVDVTGRSVRRFLDKHRTERADVAKTVVREELGRTLVADVEHLEELRLRARQIADAALATKDASGNPVPPDVKTALKAIEAERKVIDTKLHYSGAGEPDAATSLGDLMALAFKD